MPHGTAVPPAAPDRDVARSIPPHIGAAVVVLYLVTFSYWAQLLHVSLSFVIYRLCFLAIALTALIGGLGLPLSQTIGHLSLPGRAHRRFVACALGGTILLRVAVKLVAQHVLHGTDMRAFTAWNFTTECIIPPLSEEPVFRGLLLLSLLSIFQTRHVAAILLSAAMFSALHSVHDLEQQIAAFLLGCLLGTVFVRTRSLSFCMLLHAGWNLMIFVRLSPAP